MKKYSTLLTILTWLIMPSGFLWAGPTLTLRSIPDISTLEIGSTIQHVTLIARVDAEGLEFRWQLDGPGALEGDLHSRKVSYRPPKRLDEKSAKVSILAIVTDSQGAVATQTLEFTLTAPAESDKIPRPHPQKKNPSPIDETHEPSVLPDDLVQRPEKLWLVLIEIGEYADEQLPDLTRREQDALKLSQLFRDPRYGGLPQEQILLLQEAEATDLAVKQAIGSWLKTQAAAEDSVLIYYAGYCLFEGQDWYWVTHDADLDDLYATALNQDDLKEMFARIPAKLVLTMLNGSILRNDRNDSLETFETSVPWDTFSEAGRTIVSAFTSVPESGEAPEYSRPDFAASLLEALKGKADTNSNGIITAEELWQALDQQAGEPQALEQALQRGPVRGAVNPDFPLTFDIELLRQRHEEALWQKKQERFVEIYRAGKITSEQFTKGFQFIKNQQHDQILEDLLDGKISIELFIETF